MRPSYRFIAPVTCADIVKRSTWSPGKHKDPLNFTSHLINMENDQGDLVDLYVPRKCSATNRLITAKDHASIQISIADVDENGVALKTATTIALCGQVRSQGEGDDSINRLATKAGALRNVWTYAK